MGNAKDPNRYPDQEKNGYHTKDTRRLKVYIIQNNDVFQSQVHVRDMWRD